MPYKPFQADLAGTTALVTGAASGIGLAAAEAFARCGARVAINHLPGDARGTEQVERLRTTGYDVISAPGDVSKAGDAERMVGEAVKALGRLDCLVNNAGISATKEPIPFSDLDRMTEEFWAAILHTNLLGPFRCTHAAAGALRAARGSVVSTASIAGLSSVGSSMAYGASKAALINMTRNLARALAPDVRVNAVAPGFVDTEWTSTWPQDRKDALIDRTPLRRACTPQDIAETMLFLCVGTLMITGQTVVVDGGLAL
jgi:3-oxoacyl-[acyl-carrier protein] reductase